jgi:glutaredoxin 3
MENGTAIQSDLTELTGQKSVPNIFIKGKHIGGCDKVHQLNSEGKLLEMI